jgi:ABC-type Fe3+-hydroxamate transport system substrate-binding protein
MEMTPGKARAVGKYYLDSLTRARAVSAPGTPPQEFTPPSPETVNDAAARIIFAFGSDQQKAWQQYLDNIDDR